MPRHAALFWSRVQQSPSCWEWTGHRSEDGYGTLRFNGQMQKAHRVAWQLTNGLIPDRFHVLHRCDNPPCVRPEHLFLGSNHDNVLDRHSKGRTNEKAWRSGRVHWAAGITHCPRGHVYDGVRPNGAHY